MMAISISIQKDRPLPGLYARVTEAFLAGVRRFKNRIRPAEVIMFASQLSLMLEIGTSLTTALRAIGSQIGNPAFKTVVTAMLQDVEEGRQLSDAMSKHHNAFPPTFINMIRAGETGGFLKKTLDSMVEMMQKRQAFLSQLRSTLAYPAVLCVLSVGVIIFIMIGILPRFAVLFAGKSQFLPLSTRALMAASHSLSTYWWAYSAGAIALALALIIFKQSATGRALRDLLLVRTPLISALANKIYTCQLLRTLGHLMESRVPLIQSLETTGGTFENRYFLKFIKEIKSNVEQGGKFSQPFSGNPLILESVKQMVATGEETGNLPKVMLRLADYYDVEIERNLKSLSTMIEPAALIVLGSVVGLIVSSVILPMFKIAGALR